MEVQEPAQQTFTHKLPLNLLIKGAQNNHGLRRGDYQQYRQYCTNKIRKIRKQMKFSLATKNKFSNRKIQQEKPQNPRSLQVLLYNAQKNWAHGNEIKDMSKNKKISKGNKNRHTIIKKFKRALDWAKRLQQACQSNSERKTAIEAEAYKLYLEGLVSFEVEQYSVASQSYIKCRQILSQLQKVSDSVTSSILKEKIEQIEASIRYCTFMESKGKQLSINQILDLKKINDPTLSAKLQSLVDNKVSSDQLTIELQNQSYPIKNPIISAHAQKIQQFDNQLTKLLERDQIDEQSHEVLLDMFGNLFVSYDQLIRIVEKDKENAQYTQAQKQNLGKLALHFQQNKLKRMLKRLQRLFTFSNSIKKQPPQTLSKILSNIMGILTQINDLQKDKSKLNNRPVDMNVIRRNDDLSFYYRTLRLHLVSQVYFNNKKILQAYSLWVETERCLEIIKSKQNISNVLIDINQLQKSVRIGKLTCMIELSKKQSKQKQDITKGVEKLKISEPKQIKQKTLEYMNNHPDLINKVTLQQLGEFDVVKLPPTLELIPPRPIFFDIMDQYIIYPSLEKKQSKPKPSGSFWDKFKIFG